MNCIQNILQARQLSVQGITSDGSALYPAAIRSIWGDLPHQICEFHVLHDLNQAILRAVAQVRKQLATQQPKLKRGHPTAAQRKLVQKRQRLQQKISDLFEHRYLLCNLTLADSERASLQRITCGLPLLRILRRIIDEICRLFDRRCRTVLALAKLAALRQRVQQVSLAD